MHVWFGYFTPFGVIRGVKGTTSQGHCYHFDVYEESNITTFNESDW